ncbi:hypothetical protein GGF37_006808, partial [Kickxella alabastrina]
MSEAYSTYSAPNAGISFLRVRAEQLPRRTVRQAQRVLRRSLSGDFVNKSIRNDMSSIDCDDSDSECDIISMLKSHQRTASDSSMAFTSLVFSAESQSTSQLQSPTKRSGRFVNALYSGLRKSPTAQSDSSSSGRSGTHTRTPTEISTDYVSISLAATAVSPTSFAGEDVITTNTIDYSMHDVNGSTNESPQTMVAGVSMLSPPATASTTDSYHSHCQGNGLNNGFGTGFDSTAGGTFRPRKRSLSVGGENSCRDFFARQIEQYGLQSLLTSPVGVCYLLASTILGYCSENLLFYLE